MSKRYIETSSPKKWLSLSDRQVIQKVKDLRQKASKIHEAKAATSPEEKQIEQTYKLYNQILNHSQYRQIVLDLSRTPPEQFRPHEQAQVKKALGELKTIFNQIRLK